MPNDTKPEDVKRFCPCGAVLREDYHPHDTCMLIAERLASAKDGPKTVKALMERGVTTDVVSRDGCAFCGNQRAPLVRKGALGDVKFCEGCIRKLAVDVRIGSWP